MENENFDEGLKNRIKQVFEGYEDGTSDEGWNRLREKFPEKKHRGYFFWWFVSAAVLFSIALLLWLFQPEANKSNSPKIVGQQKADTVSALKNTDNLSHHISASNQNPLPKNIPSETINTQKTPVKTASGLMAQNLDKQHLKKNRTAFTAIINPKKTSVKTASGLIDSQALFKNKQVQAAITQPELPSKKEKEDQLPAVFTGIKKVFVDSTIQKDRVSVTAPTGSSAQKQQAAIAKTTVREAAKPAKAGPVKKPAEKPGAFSLGLYAGAHINFANASNNQLGLGAGFSTGFRVGKNLKLSTGLGLMQNNLSYSGNIPTNTQLAASNYVPSYSVIATNANTQTSLKSTDANLLALDIPVNLTYTFLPGKNSISISAGVSSGTFIKEVYNYNYAAAASTSSTTNNQNIPGFSNFNFAKTLNLSAGFAYPFGKNTMQIEPFLKYPLGGMGSQQLRFGAAGINLKLNIQSLKSKRR